MPLRSCAPRSSSSKRLPTKSSRAFSDDHAVGHSDALQPRRKVRRLTYDCLLLRSTRSDQIAYHHQSRCDADTRLEGRIGLQITYSSHQLQPRADGSLCVILVRLRIAEIHQDPIPHVLRYEAAEALTVSATHF